MKEYQFTKFDVEKVFSDSSKSDSAFNQSLLLHGINSDIVQELSHRSWSAWEKKLYGLGKYIRLDNSVDVFKSRNHKGRVTGFDFNFRDCTISMTATKPKKHAMFTIPFIVNRDGKLAAKRKIEHSILPDKTWEHSISQMKETKLYNVQEASKDAEHCIANVALGEYGPVGIKQSTSEFLGK